MDKVESNLGFRLMALSYRFRDLIRPRMSILKEVGIKPGFHVLDYGCGPGSYLIPLAALVGKEGRIYALDVHPLALQMVQKIASKKRLKNVEIILSDCQTGLPDDSVDVVLLYDVLHDLSNADKVLEELHRVLKLNGILSIRDHHMKEDEIISKAENRGLFKLFRKGEKTFSLKKRNHSA